MEETAYKHHFELLDRYQAFSAEVLRLSLATIAAFGFFLGIEHGEGQQIAHHMISQPVPRWFIGAGLVTLVISAATALVHRYVSADAMHYILLGAARELEEDEVATKRSMLKRSETAILAAPTALAIGVSLLAGGFLVAW